MVSPAPPKEEKVLVCVSVGVAGFGAPETEWQATATSIEFPAVVLDENATVLLDAAVIVPIALCTKVTAISVGSFGLYLYAL